MILELTDNIKSANSKHNDGKIKKNIFLPSKTTIWEILSSKTNKVYFIDRKKYCSCKGFYYNKSKKYCYHLIEIEKAIINKNYNIEIQNDKNIDEIVKRFIQHIFI